MEIYTDPQRAFEMLTSKAQIGDWLRYDRVFRAQRMPWLFAVWIGQAAMLAVLAIRGRWSPLLRQAEIVLTVLTIVVLAWFRAAGPVMAEPTADQTAKAFMAMIGLFLLIDVAVKIYRRAGQVNAEALHEVLTR